MARINFGNDLLDRKVKYLKSFKIVMIEWLDLSNYKKGIIANVTLDGKILSNWTACLTNNFIPYYQQNVTKISYDNDFVSKYIKKDRYLTERKLKFVNSYWKRLDSNFILKFLGMLTLKYRLFI